ncbi:MAG: DUF2815 family protein [Allisonella histaminiformans]|uniref:DUF2815 family protein n=1 Tax=Allisonella histaminiformans TaxID=209880 RepID=UPI002357D25D|nr:DUF2815 family protein [Allisonella histaminiformans]MCI6003827.1 DUF2815 family protein [Allisonella histaminiformans]
MNEATNVTTGEVRLSYVHLFKPYAYQPGQEEKYQVTVLVPKTDTATMERINAAIAAAKQKGITDKWNGQCPPIVPTPVYDGDGVRPSDGMAFGPECKGHWVFTASAKADYPPEVVDANRNPVINQSEIYSGIYAYVNVTFFPYAFGGKKGIGCGLGPVMKVRDGESLGGSAPTAAQAFGNIPAPVQPQPSAQPMPQAGYAPAGYTAPVQQPAGYGQGSQGINPITGLPF